MKCSPILSLLSQLGIIPRPYLEPRVRLWLQLQVEALLSLVPSLSHPACNMKNRGIGKTGYNATPYLLIIMVVIISRDRPAAIPVNVKRMDDTSNFDDFEELDEQKRCEWVWPGFRCSQQTSLGLARQSWPRFSKHPYTFIYKLTHFCCTCGMIQNSLVEH